MSGKYEIKAPLQNEYVVAGSFAVDGSEDPETIYGAGFTPVHTTTGVYTITLTDPFAEVISFVPSLSLGTAVSKFAQGGTVSVANKTFVINTYLVGTGLQDLGNTAGNRINFTIVVR